MKKRVFILGVYENIGRGRSKSLSIKGVFSSEVKVRKAMRVAMRKRCEEVGPLGTFDVIWHAMAVR
jgi:hypothetical protein